MTFVGKEDRVNGKIAVSRAFGDPSLKPIIIAEPESIRVPLSGDDRFLMLTCSSISDVMSLEDMSTLLTTLVQNPQATQTMYADAIVACALKKGCAADITGWTHLSLIPFLVMIIDLNP